MNKNDRVTYRPILSLWNYVLYEDSDLWWCLKHNRHWGTCSCSITPYVLHERQEVIRVLKEYADE